MVDDDRRSTRAFEREWTSAGVPGWHVDVATTPAEAERLAAGHPFDLMVMVHRLPDVDGFSLSRRLRQAQPGAVRVLICGHSDRSRVLAAGADVHVAFPRRARAAQVADHVRAVFEAREAAGLAPEAWAALLSLDGLPTSAARCQRVSSLLRVRPFPRLAVTELVEGDPGLAALVFRAVNAPHYGVNRQVGDLPTAMALLGPWAIGEVVSAVERAAQLVPRLVLVDEAVCERAAARARLARDSALRSGAVGLAAERAYAETLLAETPGLLNQALTVAGAPTADPGGTARVLCALWALPHDSAARTDLSLDPADAVGVGPRATQLTAHHL